MSCEPRAWLRRRGRGSRRIRSSGRCDVPPGLPVDAPAGPPQAGRAPGDARPGRPSSAAWCGAWRVLLAQEATADLPTSARRGDDPAGHRRRAGSWPTPSGSSRSSAPGWAWPTGVLDLLPEAEVWHIGLFRDEQTLRPTEYYNKLPAPCRVTLALVVDPMLATGGSAVRACEVLKAAGVPRLKFLVPDRRPRGDRPALAEAMPDVPIHVGAIDERLNDVGFIYPGLGDAGDRQFGDERRPEPGDASIPTPQITINFDAGRATDSG